MIFRRSYFDDFKDILKIVRDEKKYLDENNINQWKNDLPTEKTIRNDIEDGISYVLLDSKGDIIGTTVLTYHYKNDLNHPNDVNLIDVFPYAVISRTALLAELNDTKLQDRMIRNIEIQVAKNGCSKLKIDTHKDNLDMLNFLDKIGFKRVAEDELKNGGTKIILIKDINDI